MVYDIYPHIKVIHSSVLYNLPLYGGERMRKWEVISEMLDKLINLEELEKYKKDLKKAKEIAEKIDKILVEQYGNEQTNENILQLIKEGFNYLMDNNCYKIAIMVAYSLTISTRLCTACINTSYGNCHECKFAKIAGMCSNANSLYYNFFSTIERIVIDYTGMNKDEITAFHRIFTGYVWEAIL